jgi:NAD(P)-dependent dehydrogenase (short-subunit alcohol dehydrogenase family)
MDGTERFAQGFAGHVAVVTGGGSGMGRELVRQLATAGCDVATCDVSAENLDETAAQCATDGAPGEVLTSIADVSDEAQVVAFRDTVAAWRPHVNLLFNNAGIGGGGSFVTGERSEWDRTFGVCWNGVYFTTRAFLPALMQAEIGQVVNTSSVNGFWASLGPGSPHTAYSSAKFAVKGFTEALITDFRVNAPHLRASLVMPGWVGTSIVHNSIKAHGAPPEAVDAMSGIGDAFRDNAPLTAGEAATVILDAVKAGEWRILVGADAVSLDEAVRGDPDATYRHNPFSAA